MIDQKLFSELAEKLFSDLPQSSNLNHIKTDITKTFKLALEQSFSKLDLVTREQFDIQCQVLAECKAELSALKKQVEEFELEPA